jgi:hypothetical protein
VCERQNEVVTGISACNMSTSGSNSSTVNYDDGDASKLFGGQKVCDVLGLGTLSVCKVWCR